MHYKKCEICGLRSGRDSDGKRMFMAQFPLDEDRCKQWVKFTAKEDLVYVPIEKLHSLKYLCGSHFEKKQFNKKGTRLKKTAIPSKLLPRNILPDDMLESFPCHIASHTSASETLQQLNVSHQIPVSPGSADNILHLFPNPDKHFKRFNTWRNAIGGHVASMDPNVVFELRRVCHMHFETRYHTRSKRLSSNAVPTLHLSGTSIRINTAHNDHNYSIRVRAPQSTDANGAENSAVEASRINEDGFNDNNFFDDDPQPTEPEHEEVPEPIFSWQKDTDLLPTELMDDDSDSIICPSVGEAVDLLGPADFSMYCDDEPRTAKSQPEPIGSQPEPIRSQPEPITSLEHPAEYQCNECRKDIVGFRYTCVQCADWDLCGACEARTAHATHYVLRVPSPRPYNEIQAVLAAIRQQLLTENLFLNQEFPDDSLKVEVKDEPSEAPPAAPEPAPEPDPLEGDSDSDCRGYSTRAEDSSEESDGSSSPRHEVHSHRSLRPDKTEKNSAIAPREKPVLAVQEHPTISDHIDLTGAVVSYNDTNIPTSVKPTRIFTSNNPTRIISSGNGTNKLASINPNLLTSKDSTSLTVENPARKPDYENVTKSIAQTNPLAPTARDTIPRVLAYNKQQPPSNNPTNLIADNNIARLQSYEYRRRIPTTGDPTTKVTYYKPTRLLTTNSPTRKVVHDYLTKRASDNKGTPHRTVQPTDDVICLDNTPNTTSIGNLNTVESHIDTLQSQIVGSNIVPLHTSEVPDRVKSRLETNQSQLQNHHQTIVLRVPSSTNDVDLARALQSKVSVRLEPLRIEVIDFIPAKQKKTEI